MGMQEYLKIKYQQNRRDFLRGSALGLGGIALGSLLGCNSKPSQKIISQILEEQNIPLGSPHFLPKAKRVIICFKVAGLLKWNCLITNLSCIKCMVKKYLLRSWVKIEFLEW